MSASDIVLPGNSPPSRAPVKRSRFAGARAGAWLFAASFSVGIWGLALKILTPDHPAAPSFALTQYAVLAPSDFSDGRARVIWASEIITSPTGFPVIGGAVVIGLKPSTR